jgi:HEAT repeat protein
LLRLLRDTEGGVREAAAHALRRLKDPRAAEPLVAALKDPCDEVRRAAAKALLGIGEPAVAPLVAALGDDDPIFRYRVADTVAKMGASAVPPLGAALRDERPPVRWAAAVALQCSRSPEAHRAVDEFAKDKDLAELARNYEAAWKGAAANQHYLFILAVERHGKLAMANYLRERAPLFEVAVENWGRRHGYARSQYSPELQDSSGW